MMNKTVFILSHRDQGFSSLFYHNNITLLLLWLESASRLLRKIIREGKWKCFWTIQEAFPYGINLSSMKSNYQAVSKVKCSWLVRVVWFNDSGALGDCDPWLTCVRKSVWRQLYWYLLGGERFIIWHRLSKLCLDMGREFWDESSNNVQFIMRFFTILFSKWESAHQSWTPLQRRR